MTVLTTLIRWLLAALLALAALSKLGDPQAFLAALAGYQLPLPSFLLLWVAMTLPWLELMLAGLLAINVWRLTAPLLTLLLFGSFTLLTAQAWWRGLAIDCGCFNLQFLSNWLPDPFLKQLASPAGV